MNGIRSFVVALSSLLFFIESSWCEQMMYPDFTDARGEDDFQQNGNSRTVVLGSRVGGPMVRCPRIRNTLRNGQVKLRNRGRIAKFTCYPGYTMHGKTFSTCLRGQWNNPVPICLAPGCETMASPANGRQKSLYNSGMLTYSCDPGYVLRGSPSVHCNGHAWNHTIVPSCNVAVRNPPTHCDFEDETLCHWTNDDSDDFDWKRHQLVTPSGHVGTGPSFDHTMSSGLGGYYLYIEASAPRKENDKARLFSPVYSATLSPGCFVMWYHMYGANTGVLRVYIKRNEQVLSELPTAWILRGEQGNQWFRATVTVPQMTTNFQIVIEGEVGDGYVSDTAIDDVSLRNSSCQEVINTENSGEMIGTCANRCSSMDTHGNETCQCNASCERSVTCCRDYWSICVRDKDASSTLPSDEAAIGSKTTISNTDLASESADENPELPAAVSQTEQSITTNTEIPITTTTPAQTTQFNPTTPLDNVITTTTITENPTTITTTPKPTTTTPMPAITTPKPAITTPMPTTTTPRPTTTTPRPTTTTPRPTTTTSRPTTTTPMPTTTTPRPTTTTPRPTTTTPRPTTTTPRPTTTQKPITTTQKPTTLPTTMSTQKPTTTSEKTTITTTTQTPTTTSTTPQIVTTTTQKSTTPTATTQKPTTSTQKPTLATTTSEKSTITTPKPTTARATTTAKLTTAGPTTTIASRTTPEPTQKAPNTSEQPSDPDYDEYEIDPDTEEGTNEDSSRLIQPFAVNDHRKSQETKGGLTTAVILSITAVSVAVSAGFAYVFFKWRAHQKMKAEDPMHTRFLSDSEEVYFAEVDRNGREVREEDMWHKNRYV